MNKDLYIKTKEIEVSIEKKNIADSSNFQSILYLNQVMFYKKKIIEYERLWNKNNNISQSKNEIKNKLDSLLNDKEYHEQKNEVDSLLKKSKIENHEFKKKMDLILIDIDFSKNYLNFYFYIILIFSFFLICYGFINWRSLQLDSDNTAKLNLEKIKLEVENLKLSQKRYIVNKPLSENEEFND